MKHKKLFILGLAGILFCTSANSYVEGRMTHNTYFSSKKGNSGNYTANANCTEISVYGDATWDAKDGITDISYQTYVYYGAAGGIQEAYGNETTSNSNTCSISFDASGMYAIHATYMIFYADKQVVIDYDSTND